MSQLLSRLEDRLLVETDPNLRAESVARRACYLARVGRFDESRRDIADVRHVFGDGRNGRVTILIMIAEALGLHFEKLEHGAVDRVVRALLLAQAMKDRELTALASAWRAHLAFEESDFELAMRSVRIALQNASEVDHAAVSRCAVVLLNGFALAGDSAQSQYWFTKGRQHALAEGDQATIDALLHSRAAFGTAWLRVQRCKGEVTTADVTRMRNEISSARNLQHLTRIAAHAQYIDLCDARLQLVEGKYEGAMNILTSIRNAGPFPEGHFNQELVDLELTYCNLMRGASESISTKSSCFQKEAFDQLDADDQLCAAWLDLELSRASGHALKAAEDRLAKATVAYDSWLDSLRNTLVEHRAS